MYVAVALAFLVTTRTAIAADETIEPPVGVALVAGAGLAVASLCVGGAFFANSDDLGVRRPSLYGAMIGLSLAPAVAHLIAREWSRAAIFTIAPAVGTAIGIAFLELYPDLLDHGEPFERVLFGVGLTVAVFGAVVGLADVPGASDRWRARHPLAVAPLLSARGAGLAVGGRF
jgi:hypothetical protein